MNAALLSAVKSVNADHLSFEDRTNSVLPASPEAHTQVGGGRHSLFWRDLTPEQREFAIELAELKQAEYTASGQHQRAAWMRDLELHLIAGRNQGAKE